MLTFLLAATLAAPLPGGQTKPSLVGQVVISREVTPQYLVKGAEGQFTPGGRLLGTEWYVIADRGDRLQVRNQGEDVWVNRADVMHGKEAVAYYAEILKANPSATMYMKLAKAHELLQDWDAAISAYDEALKLQPGTYAYLNNRANYWNRKREYAKSAADYDAALALAPQAHIPLSNRGSLYFTTRDLDKAIEFYNRSIEAQPDYARGYAGRAAVHRERRELDRAVADADRGVELDGKSPHTLNARGLIRVSLGQRDKAMADFNEALRFDPAFSSAYYNRAGVHLDEKRYHDAIRDLETAMRLSKGNTAAYARRAEAWAAVGNWEHARQDLAEALKIDPEYAPAYRSKAWLLATRPDDKQRDGKEALAAATKAVELWKNGGPLFQEAMAAALAETGDFDGAIAIQSKLVADLAYIEEKGNAVRKRLEAYKAKKPWRE